MNALKLILMSGSSVFNDITDRDNDLVRQHGNFKEFHSNSKLIEFISACIPLMPGEIIATGTPVGIGPLKPGETGLCCVTGFGDLINPLELNFRKSVKDKK